MKDNDKQQLISIIMPCYNGERYLLRSIHSVLDQSYRNLELIVINDGSTDGSLDLMHSFKDSRIHVISQVNRGVSAARNRGLEIAKGDLVAFLDSDDTWETDFLKELYDALQKKPEAILAYCGWQNIGIPGPRGDPFIPPDYENDNKLELLFRNCRWPIHAVLTYRSAILDSGGFNEEFTISEDYYLWLQIATSQPIIRVPRVLTYYHHHGTTQATFDTASVAINHWNVQQHYLRKHPEANNILGKRKILELTTGELLRKGYTCYWNRDMGNARRIFKRVMRLGYGKLADWKYMLPSLLPLRFHEMLVKRYSTDWQ